MNRFMIGVVRDALFSGSRGGTGMTPDSTPLNGGWGNNDGGGESPVDERFALGTEKGEE